MSNYLIGGRLGDAVHALYVAKNTPGRHNLFITDQRSFHSDGFLHDLQRTYDELYPIISVQEYCAGFFPYTFDALNVHIDENLSLWRRYAYSASWTQLLANTFNVPVNGEPWIAWEKKDFWSDVVLVHQSVHEARRGHHWDTALQMYEGRIIFIGNEEEYKVFGRDIPFHKPETISDYFTAINSCKFFIGNQSAPLAIAHSLGVPRLAMLNEVDRIHYVGEERFCRDFYWMAKDDAYWPALNFENVR